MDQQVNSQVFVPIGRLLDRVETEKTDSDVAAFYALLYLGEFIVKLTACYFASGVSDRERAKYTVLYRLVRSGGVGDFAQAVDEILIGPTYQYLRESYHPDQKQLTIKVGPGESSYSALEALNEACVAMGLSPERLPEKSQLRRWFTLFAELRNKTRGHGAALSRQCSATVPALERSISLLITNLELLKRDWAFIKRNLSGKYRVVPFGVNRDCFLELRGKPTLNLSTNGIYVDVDGPSFVDLFEADEDLSDFFLPNGGFRATTSNYEALSLITNSRRDSDARRFISPADVLLPSETHGGITLDVVGSAFCNVPDSLPGYVKRSDVEREIKEKLLADRYEVITLTGPGGAGKTSVALSVLHEIMNESTRFECIIWFGARDIDLMDSGPKPVRPAGTTVDDFSVQYWNMIGRIEGNRTVKRDYFASQLAVSEIGPTLFVFDNFETVDDALGTFQWLDERIRQPNKILITTRVREFSGDRPIKVEGMTDSEAAELVAQVSARLGISDLINSDLVEELVREAGGHPYAIKIMLGEVAAAKRWVKPERVFAEKDKILAALFERTYASLTPGAQFVFSVLSGWKSAVPEVAIEAVLLLHSEDRLEVSSLVDELERVSLIDSVRLDSGTKLISMPVPAMMFGKKKLLTSSHRLLAEKCIDTLHYFGATSRGADVRQLKSPLERFFTSIEREMDNGKVTFLEFRPVLEYLASEHPPLWRQLERFASIYLEGRESDEIRLGYLRRLIESDPDGNSVVDAWSELAALLGKLGDIQGEILAYSQVALLPGISVRTVSDAANKLNTALKVRSLTGSSSLDLSTKREALKRIITRMERMLDELDATDISRLAWACLNVGDDQRAEQLARLGLSRDQDNEHCVRLLYRLTN